MIKENKEKKKKDWFQYINDINSIFDLNITIDDMIQILFNDNQIYKKDYEKEKLAQDILDKDENFEERKENKSLINSINEKYKNTNLSYQQIKQKIKDKQIFYHFSRC